MTAIQRGDYLSIHTHGLPALGIQIGTRSWFNHAALYVGIVDGIPSIVEANPAGVQLSPLSRYDRLSYVVSRIPLSPWQRAKICAEARRLVDARVGYGWLDIVALAGVQLGWTPSCVDERARRDDRLVCSQVVTACYEAAGLSIIPGVDPWAVTPGDLAREELVELSA